MARSSRRNDLGRYVKCGSLMVPQQKLEEYLKEVHKNQERFRELVIPSDMPPIGEIGDIPRAKS